MKVSVILILDFWNYTINWILTISLLYLLLIMKMLYDQEVEYIKGLLWLMLIIQRMPGDWLKIFERIINEFRVGNEMQGSYTINIRNNYNNVINYGQIERSNYKNNFSNQYNTNVFNIQTGNNNRNQRNFRNSPMNIVTHGIQNNNLNKYTKPRQNIHNYYIFGIDNNNSNNLNISNDNNLSYHCRNRKILKSNLKLVQQIVQQILIILRIIIK